MKNYVLIDFTEESIDALRYATDFTKITKGSLEIVNVAEESKRAESLKNLEELKNQFSTDEFEIKINELVGDMEDVLPDFLNQEKIGFVFCGTHELRRLEPFFSSRMLNLMNSVKTNFIFIPKEVKEFKPLHEVMVPIFTDKHSIKNLEALRYLHQYMPFNIRLITSKSKDPELSANMVVASKLLSQSDLPYKTDFFGNSEDDLRNTLADTAKMLDVDMISIVNLTEVNLFNFGAKGFVENLIRNKNGLPILVIQNKQTAHYSGFHTTGGY